jgi:predicted ATP-grasp superfamily ATP-dependent carboligase
MRPQAFLFLGDYYGTLASTRCLGERGVPILLADERRLVRATGSRYIEKRLLCPPVSDADAFIRWLLAQREAYPGAVLFPASDELVFLFAKHQDELKKGFRLFMPSMDSTFRILNKHRLYDACVAAGISFPKTWFPNGEAGLREILGEIDVEVILKPKSQSQLRTGTKAAEAPRGEELVRAFADFVRDNPYGPELVAHDAEVVWPMLQEYHRHAAFQIYSLAGFADAGGRPPIVRASRKVLQRPRKLGVGLCFEGTTVNPELVHKIGVLCKNLDYAGIFEIEFIEHGGENLLIDFNPRPYGQMAFEVARDAPLPWLHYLAAIGDDAEYAKAYDRALAWEPRGEHAFTHRLILGAVDGAQRVTALTGGPAKEDWRGWMRRHGPNLADAVRRPKDPGPVLTDGLVHLLEFVRHPRSWLRSLAR